MPQVTTGTTSINFGSTLRIGYRTYGSSSPYTYIGYFPSYNELPYLFNIPSSGTYEIEYTQICPSCTADKYSSAETAVVSI